MDIGFGALLEKFEQHVGLRATRVLIFIIFVAVFALCARSIWDNLVSPMLTFFSTPMWGTTLVQIGLMALSVGLGIAFGAQVIAAFRSWKDVKKSKAILNKVETMHSEQIGNIRRMVSETRELSDQNKALLQGIMDLGSRLLQREAATAKDREAIRSLFADLKQELEDGVAADENSTTSIVQRVLEGEAKSKTKKKR